MRGPVAFPGKASTRKAAFLAEILVASIVPVVPSPAPHASQHAPTWIPVDVPHAVIAAVSCPTATTCVAVGSYREAGGHLRGLLASLSKGTWSAALAPLPAGTSGGDNAGDSSLSVVNCPGRETCVAVGWEAGANGDPHGLLETSSAGTWTPTEAPVPARVATSSAASLTAVSCASTRTCVAVGNYFDPQPSAQGLIETYAAGHWTATQAPTPPNAASLPEVFLQTVNCPAADACVTVGSYDDTGGNIPQLIETLVHGGWTPTEVARAAVLALSCPAAGSCVAVGTAYGRVGRLHGLIETLSKGTWKARQAPLPRNAAADRSPILDAVTCPVVGSCVAVGAYTSTRREQDGLIDALTGRRWRSITLPLPAAVDAHHDALVCLTSASCVAVGSYLDTNGAALHALVETLSGATWKTWRVPLPPNAEGANPYASFNDMTCTKAGTCVAVGWYRDSSGATEGLIETPLGRGPRE